MSDDPFIFVDSLRKGKVEHFHSEFSQSSFVVKDQEWRVISPASVDGEASISGRELLLQLKIQTEVQVQCKICNQWQTIPLHIKEIYHAVPLSQIKKGRFDMTPLIYESICLSVPHFFECHEGNCPERQYMTQYFTQFQEEGEDHGCST